MSQKRINFLNVEPFQYLKGRAIDDLSAVDSVDRIWLDGVDPGDSIVDVNMRTASLGTTLDWTVGAGPNDHIVKIVREDFSVQQNLDLARLTPRAAFPIVQVGSQTSHNTIGSAAAIFDEKIVLHEDDNSGSAAGVSYFDFSTGLWHHFFDGTSGTTLNQPDLVSTSGYVIGLVVYQSKLIVAYSSGQVSSWDGTNWKFFDGTGTGTGPYTNNSLLSVTRSVIVYGAQLLVCGQETVVTDSMAISSFDGTNWKFWNGTGTGTGLYLSGTAQGQSAHLLIDKAVLSNGVLAFSTRSGGNIAYIFSWDGTNWRWSDGSGGGTGPSDDGTAKGGNGVYVISAYRNGIVTTSQVPSGKNKFNRVSSFDGYNWKYYNGSGSGTGPYDNAGGVLTSNPSQAMYWQYGGTTYIQVSFNAQLAGWDSATGLWHKYDGTGGGSAPYNNGTVLGGVAIGFLVWFKNNLIVMSSASNFGSNCRIAGYSGPSAAWRNYDGSGSGAGYYAQAPLGTTGFGQSGDNILGFLHVGTQNDSASQLVIWGYGGRLTSLDGSYSGTPPVKIKYWDGTGTGTGLYNGGWALGGRYATFFAGNSGIIAGATQIGDIVYLVSSYERIASYSISGNSWTDFDGSSAVAPIIKNNFYGPDQS